MKGPNRHPFRRGLTFALVFLGTMALVYLVCIFAYSYSITASHFTPQ